MAGTYTPDSDAPAREPSPRGLGVLSLVVGIVAALLTIGAAAKKAADSTYVRADSFVVQHQRDSSRIQAQHQRDSLILDARLSRIEDHVANSDTNSKEALRILRGRR